MNLYVYALLGIVAAALLAGAALPDALASQVDSPSKQLESGVLPEDIQCRQGKVLVIRDNGDPACVKESTAEKMGWDIIATEFAQKGGDVKEEKTEPKTATNEDENAANNNNGQPEQEFIVMDLGSDVEFVDDGREQHRAALQKSPAPRNIYEKIIDSQEDNKIDPEGTMRVPAGFAHEKYTVTPGIGLYPADWMPTHVPDGYKLLFFENFYYEDTTGDAVLTIHFVPNTFELTNQTTTHALQNSGGFMIRVSYQVEPFDEIEDRIEEAKERKESKPDYVGRWLDVQRDGKTVYASETQTFYDDYRAIYSFSPNDNTIVGVLSYYHTLEELEPIFNSVMN